MNEDIMRRQQQARAANASRAGHVVRVRRTKPQRHVTLCHRRKLDNNNRAPPRCSRVPHMAFCAAVLRAAVPVGTARSNGARLLLVTRCLSCGKPAGRRALRRRFCSACVPINQQ